VGGPGAADQATDGDDRVGEVEEGIDDDLAAFVAAGEPTEGVVLGVGSFDVPAAGGLDRCFLAFMGDLAGQLAVCEQRARLAGVVAGVQMDGDVVGEWAEISQGIQGGPAAVSRCG
jgi:hypothetical protein